MKKYDVIIIGTGPAGYTAALYASRAFMATLMFTGAEPGGQLTTTTEVDNYPGFPQGIQGPELVELMKNQVIRFGTKVVLDTVTALEVPALGEKPTAARFRVRTSGSIYESRAVIVASGASAKMLGIPSEEKFRGKGVSYCATCDGFFFRDKELVVLGGGDTAMEEATFLTKFASKVTVIHRREDFRASAIMLDRARKDPKISFLTNKTVAEFTGDPALSGVRLKDTVTGIESTLSAGGAFIAIGHKPNTDYLKGVIELDAKGYVIIKSQQLTEKLKSDKSQDAEVNPMLKPQTETSVPGGFAAGDCVDPRYRQAIVAAGMGCMAAMDAEKWLAEHA